ncbi:acyloxyacyl hydrolase [Halomonas sp. EGI 63088]|uniref:Acyloxyacyl hydrolase n=1 Tax=Halomonas flagellata TaxID=2920385 RepID=A0ABS9RTR5_9GAMM|nr:acyloxyacyl hydrolase [Halomonas flagellata]MCH4563241.1 acyloxyacyl hydrolase [Halomonas flagellata]
MNVSPLPALTLAVALALLSLIMTTDAYADPSLELGSTSVSTPALRVTLDRDYDLSHWHPQLSLRLATGVLLLPGDDEDDNAAWVLTPAFRYTFAGERSIFVEGSVGAGLFLNTRVESRELSTAFQFESRIATGVKLGKGGELGISAVHYSNAHIKPPNNGLEAYSVTYRHPW